MFGWTEILIVLLILLLVFGASRLPELARSIGESVGALKEGLEEGRDLTQEELDEEDASGVPGAGEDIDSGEKEADGS